MDLSPLALAFHRYSCKSFNYREKSSGDRFSTCLTPISHVKILETLLA